MTRPPRPRKQLDKPLHPMQKSIHGKHATQNSPGPVHPSAGMEPVPVGPGAGVEGDRQGQHSGEVVGGESAPFRLHEGGMAA